MRAAPIPGERFGPYDILAPLGAGGMGLVFRARDTRLGREVALKTLPPESLSDPTRRQRFEAEARAASALNHPNVVSVFDVGTENGTPFLVTELLSGETLREKLKSGPLPPRKVIELAVQVAHGLAAVHEKGLVHRDLKPENLFITREGSLKILDFGVARTSESATPPSGTLPLTQSGAIMGTAGYMAPEQVRGQVADARSDLFALGAIIYECLSGQLAFPGETPVERGYKILNADPAELKVTAPPSLLRVMHKCLEKSPEQRLQNAKDLAFALEAITASGEQAVPTTPRRKNLAYALAGAAIATTIALAVALNVPSKKPAPPISAHRVSYRTGSISNARFSGDGRALVYSAAFEGEPTRIFAGRFDGPELRPVAPAGAVLIDISSRDELLMGQVKPEKSVMGIVLSRGALAGGAAREILRDVMWADFGPEDQLLLLRWSEHQVHLESPPGHEILRTIDKISDARFSPDGKYIALQRHPVINDDRGTVEIIDLQGRLIARSKPAWTLGGVAWAPSGHEVFFAAGYETVARNLYAMTVGGDEREVYAAAGVIQLHDVDARGRVLLSTGTSRARLFGKSFGSEHERSLGWLDGSSPAGLAPDGKALLFLEGHGTAASAEIQTWFRRFDTDDDTPVMLSSGWGRALSPDKQWALVSPTPPYNTLRLVPTGAGSSFDLPTPGFSGLPRAHFFADGTRVIFTGLDANGSPGIYVQRLPLGTREPQPDLQPQRVGELEMELGPPPSPDGRFIVAWSKDSQQFLVDLTTGEASRLAGFGKEDVPVQWTEDGKALWVARYANPYLKQEVQVFRYELATGKLELADALSPPDSAGIAEMRHLSLTPDGEHYVYTAHQMLDELYVLEGVR